MSKPKFSPALRRLMPFAVIGCIAAPLPALAADLPHQEPGFFAGGGAIYTRLQNKFTDQSFPDDSDDFDDDRVSWKAFAGVRVNPILSIEGQYVDFGDAENDAARVEADGWTAALVADIPLHYVQPYAKAGALFWHTDAHLRGALSSASKVKSDGTDFFWGLGLRIPLNEAVELRAEYERYKLNGDADGDDDYSVDSKVDAASLNLQFNF
ncbi:porin family protein [Solimonas marina]|nr:porin family protein [Solimonas marina]